MTTAPARRRLFAVVECGLRAFRVFNWDVTSLQAQKFRRLPTEGLRTSINGTENTDGELDMEAEGTRPLSVDCSCVGGCVGYECIKQRSTALVSAGRMLEARELVELSLREQEEGPCAEQVRNIYQLILSGNRRERSRSHSLSNERRGSLNSRGEEQQLAANATSSPQISGNDSRPHPGPGKRRRVEEAETASGILGDDFDCILCSKLLFEPVTTPCGHTFCRNCLARAIDRTDNCPMCRTVLHLEDPSSLPVTNVLRNAIQRLFPDEYENRRKEFEADAPSAENAMSRLPLFPLNAVVFPMQRFPMHIFEPRYRLMLRRLMHGSRKFGLIALKRSKEGGSELCSVGCVLEVTKADRFPDGRSLIETVARERFKVHGRNEVDGYLVGRAEVYEDNEDTDTDEVKEVEARVRGIVEKLMEKGSRLPTMQHALQRAGDVPTEAQGPGALGMWLAGMLVSDDNERQNMLEMRNSATRLKEMVAILEKFRDSMAATANANGDSSRECCVQ